MMFGVQPRLDSPIRRKMELHVRQDAVIRDRKREIEELDEVIANRRAQLEASIADKLEELRAIEAVLVERRKEIADFNEINGIGVPGTRAAAIARAFREAQHIFGVKPLEIKGGTRARNTCYARFFVAQRLRDGTTLSYPAIGRVLGGRDHTTIIHACSMMIREKVAVYLEEREPV